MTTLTKININDKSSGSLFEASQYNADITLLVNAINKSIDEINAIDHTTTKGNVRQITADLTALTTRLTNEIARATAKENTLETSIATETTRATTKENALETAIATERTRATTKENSLQSSIGTNTSNIAANTSQVATNKTGVATNKTAIATETTRATTKENSLETAIANLKTLLETADNGIKSRLTAIENRRSKQLTFADFDTSDSTVSVYVDSDFDTPAEFAHDNAFLAFNERQTSVTTFAAYNRAGTKQFEKSVEYFDEKLNRVVSSHTFVPRKWYYVSYQSSNDKIRITIPQENTSAALQSLQNSLNTLSTTVTALNTAVSALNTYKTTSTAKDRVQDTKIAAVEGKTSGMSKSGSVLTISDTVNVNAPLQIGGKSLEAVRQKVIELSKSYRVNDLIRNAIGKTPLSKNANKYFAVGEDLNNNFKPEFVTFDTTSRKLSVNFPVPIALYSKEQESAAWLEQLKGEINYAINADPAASGDETFWFVLRHNTADELKTWAWQRVSDISGNPSVGSTEIPVFKYTITTAGVVKDIKLYEGADLVKKNYSNMTEEVIKNIADISAVKSRLDRPPKHTSATHPDNIVFTLSDLDSSLTDTTATAAAIVGSGNAISKVRRLTGYLTRKIMAAHQRGDHKLQGAPNATLFIGAVNSGSYSDILPKIKKIFNDIWLGSRKNPGNSTPPAAFAITWQNINSKQIIADVTYYEGLTAENMMMVITNSYDYSTYGNGYASHDANRAQWNTLIPYFDGIGNAGQNLSTGSKQVPDEQWRNLHLHLNPSLFNQGLQGSPQWHTLAGQELTNMREIIPLNTPVPKIYDSTKSGEKWDQVRYELEFYVYVGNVKDNNPDNDVTQKIKVELIGNITQKSYAIKFAYNSYEDIRVSVDRWFANSNDTTNPPRIKVEMANQSNAKWKVSTSNFIIRKIDYDNTITLGIGTEGKKGDIGPQGPDGIGVNADPKATSATQLGLANSAFTGKTFDEAIELIGANLDDKITDSSNSHFYKYPNFSFDLTQSEFSTLKGIITDKHPNDYDAATLIITQLSDNGFKFRTVHTFSSGSKHEYFGEAKSTKHTYTVQGSGSSRTWLRKWTITSDYEVAAGGSTPTGVSSKEELVLMVNGALDFTSTQKTQFRNFVNKKPNNTTTYVFTATMKNPSNNKVLTLERFFYSPNAANADMEISGNYGYVELQNIWTGTPKLGSHSYQFSRVNLLKVEKYTQ